MPGSRVRVPPLLFEKACDPNGLRALSLRVPSEHRANLRQLLEQPPGMGGGFRSSTDPEIARHLAVLQSLQELQSAEWQRAPEATPRGGERTGIEVPVTVALVPDLGAPDMRAVVIRRPNDRGQPLLLLRESDATTTDLGRGLRAAAMSVRRYGAVPARAMTMQFRTFRGTATTNSASTQALLDMVRSSPVRSIAGVGRVPAAEIIASLTAPRTR